MNRNVKIKQKMSSLDSCEKLTKLESKDRGKGKGKNEKGQKGKRAKGQRTNCNFPDKQTNKRHSVDKKTSKRQSVDEKTKCRRKDRKTRQSVYLSTS